MSVTGKIFSVFKKEIRSEFKTKSSLSATLLFIITTVIIVSFIVAQTDFDPSLYSGLIWLILFFSSMISQIRTFLSEEEKKTNILLMIYSNSTSVYFGKLIYNIALGALTNIAAVLILILFNSNIVFASSFDFWMTIVIGSFGLSSGATIVSAIISKAGSKNALFPVLSFPVLLPIILTGLDALKSTMSIDASITDITDNLIFITGFSGAIITVSYLLFDFVWED